MTAIEQIAAAQHDILNRIAMLSARLDSQESAPRLRYGINGLAEFLQISRATAQRLKNSGRVPYVLIGRKMVFEERAVIEALTRNKPTK